MPSHPAAGHVYRMHRGDDPNETQHNSVSQFLTARRRSLGRVALLRQVLCLNSAQHKKCHRFNMNSVGPNEVMHVKLSV